MALWREVMEGREVWQYGQLTMPENVSYVRTLVKTATAK